MNRFQLYELVKSELHMLSLNSADTLCNTALYFYYGRNCYDCKLHNPQVKGHCCLQLLNISAQQLKADITIKHPELLI